MSNSDPFGSDISAASDKNGGPRAGAACPALRDLDPALRQGGLQPAWPSAPLRIRATSTTISGSARTMCANITPTELFSGQSEAEFQEFLDNAISGERPTKPFGRATQNRNGRARHRRSAWKSPAPTAPIPNCEPSSRKLP